MSHGETLKELVESSYPLYVMNFRIVEELDNGDEVITYFQIHDLVDGYHWEYDGKQHGPFGNMQAAIDAAYDNLIPVSG